MQEMPLEAGMDLLWRKDTECLAGESDPLYFDLTTSHSSAEWTDSSFSYADLLRVYFFVFFQKQTPAFNNFQNHLSSFIEALESFFFF